MPVEGFPPSTEAIREWFRRAYGREATELEVGELQDKLARRNATPPLNDKLPTENTNE